MTGPLTLLRRHLLAPFAGLPRNVQGMLLMLVATACFSAMQAIVRAVSQEIPPFEVAFFRNFIGLLVLLPILAREGIGILRTNRPRLHIARGTIQGLSMLAFFTGLSMTPLPDATALSFSAPLFAPLMAVIFLRERLRIRRMAALVVGFIGVMVVIRPGFIEIHTGVILIVMASLAWAAGMLVIRTLGRTDSSVTQTIYAGIIMTPLTFVPAAFVWEWPTLEQYGWFLAIGACGSTGQICLAQAFRMADVSAVAPFDFTRMVWASLLSLFVFSQWPSIWSWVGGALICASASYIAIREAQIARTARLQKNLTSRPSGEG